MKIKIAILTLAILLFFANFVLSPSLSEEAKLVEENNVSIDINSKSEEIFKKELTNEEKITEIILRLQPNISKDKAQEIARLTVENAKEYELNPYWMLSMMYVESSFNQNSKSEKGARGLMQIIPSTAKIYGVTSEQLSDPTININTGFKYYKHLLDKFNDQMLATVAYNQGPTNVTRGKYRTWYYTKVKNVYEEILNIKQRMEEMYDEIE